MAETEIRLVADRSKRRRFTTAYKVAIVAEYDRSIEPGARGALLRREHLHRARVYEWRRARDAGALNALTVKPSGLKPAKTDVERRVKKLESELTRTREDLARKATTCNYLEKRMS